MAHMSKKKLFALLTKITGDETYNTLGLKHPRITNETYGKKSCIYVDADSPEARPLLEDRLTAAGFHVNRGYWKGSRCTEVTVSYFKGWHWDE